MPDKTKEDYNRLFEKYGMPELSNCKNMGEVFQATGIVLWLLQKTEQRMAAAKAALETTP